MKTDNTYQYVYLLQYVANGMWAAKNSISVYGVSVDRTPRIRATMSLLRVTRRDEADGTIFLDSGSFGDDTWQVHDLRYTTILANNF